jgi:hypothetical protein
LTVAELQEQIAELKKLVDESQKETTKKSKEDAEQAKRLAKIAAEDEEYVEIKLFRDNGRYQDDVPVGCNGEVIRIKRGERVRIKRKFAKILDNSEHQDYETSKLIEAATQTKKLADL